MKSDPSGSSSSLERARELSHRLTGASPAAPVRRPAFVSFRGQPASPAPPVSASAGPLPAPVAPAQAPSVPAALPPLPERLGEGGRRWEPLLSWARQASGASAAILMDPHGLLIASVGEIPLPDVEAIGARLMASLDYARPMAQPGGIPPNVIIAFDEVVITGFEVRLPDETCLTICLAAGSPVPRPLCAVLEKKFLEGLAASG